MTASSFGITPILALDFTTAILDSRISFTRANNTATQVNSSGNVETVLANVARFDYNPLTLVCKGLLIEQQRDNLLLHSSDYSQSSWTKSAVTVSTDVVVSPSGINDADKIVETTATGLHFFNQANTVTTSSAITFSFFAKAGERTIVLVHLANPAAPGNRAEAIFNLSTGAASDVINVGAATGATASIVNYGNGWYRCILTATLNSGTLGMGRCFLVDGSGNPSYTGNGTSGTYFWGVQLEQGAFATSYIPTTTAVVTRSPDVATITGANFSSFWQAGKGGALAQVTPSTVSEIRPLVQFDDNTANEIIALRGNTTNPELYIVDGGTPQAQIDAGTIAANTAYSLTGWWATNDCKARKDSGAVVTDTIATIPTVTQMRIGSDGTNYLNGTIATINYYDSFFGRPIYTRRKNKVFPSLL